MSRPGGVMDFLRRLWSSEGGEAFPGGEGIKSLWLSWEEMASDIGRTLKTDVFRRLGRRVRPEVRITALAEAFPSSHTIQALERVDVLVGCVDGWDVRDDLNSYALERRIPYIDIGAVITPPTLGSGLRASGQIAVVLPGGPCLRCMGLVTD